MAKLKTLVKQLSNQDFEIVYEQLLTSNAEKSAQLLRFLRERQLSDNKIMEALEVNTNAYYTLRSRLNMKIEEYLVHQMENPRTDLMRKVANVGEAIFTKRRALAIATLKKLEKELKDYDLANELTVVYKHLKHLHLNGAEAFSYSQLYNRHVAYMLALDKAEDLLADYFRKYGSYLMTASDLEKLELTLLRKEIGNIAQLYESHRLRVYYNCCDIFHRIYVEPELNDKLDLSSLEDLFIDMELIMDKYYRDLNYHHLQLVFEYLKLLYYQQQGNFRKAEGQSEEIADRAGILMGNYHLYTFPSHYLTTAIVRSQRNDSAVQLHKQFTEIFQDTEIDADDVPRGIVFHSCRAVAAMLAKDYEGSGRILVGMINELNLKKYPLAHIEVKLLLCLAYSLQKDEELMSQNINSLQRQIRLYGDENTRHASMFIKAMKTAVVGNRANKTAKIKATLEKVGDHSLNHFSPILLIHFNEDFINEMV